MQSSSSEQIMTHGRELCALSHVQEMKNTHDPHITPHINILQDVCRISGPSFMNTDDDNDRTNIKILVVKFPQYSFKTLRNEHIQSIPMFLGNWRLTIFSHMLPNNMADSEEGISGQSAACTCSRTANLPFEASTAAALLFYSMAR